MIIIRIRTKLLNEKRQREDIEMDIAKMKTQLEKILEDNHYLRKETELKEINQKIAQQRHDEDEHLDNENLAVKIKLIDELQVEKVYLKITDFNELLGETFYCNGKGS